MYYLQLHLLAKKKIIIYRVGYTNTILKYTNVSRIKEKILTQNIKYVVQVINDHIILKNQSS